MGLAAGSGHLRKRTGPKDAELRLARVCYNHLAGDMGIQMFDSLIRRGYMALEHETLHLTDAGATFCNDFEIDIESLRKARAPMCRECLDWSERRSHLAGSLGRAFLTRFEELSWAKRDKATRVVTFSRGGRNAFNRLFPTKIDGVDAPFRSGIEMCQTGF